MKKFIEGIVGIIIMTISLLTPFLIAGHRYRGTNQNDLERTWPGDDMVPQPKGEYLHAIRINAPAATVWKWLIQIGQDRGGFYSYELLENLIGCNIHNADEIKPEYQRLEIGDAVPMHPKMGFPYKVAAIEPNSYLLLTLRVDTETGKSFGAGEALPRKYQNQSWLFCLEEDEKGRTRMISRSRNDWNQSFGNTVFYGIFGPITIEMDRKMLKGIKQRSETRKA